MAVSYIATIYDELLDYLASKATPEDVLAFRPSEEAEARAVYLSEQNGAGLLTPDESLKLQQLLDFDRKVGLLKARDALALKQQ
ncbi:MAG: hypothetical protein SF029_14175 [bacterium]|nr:hypothetical protein [bacterium]